MESIFYLISNLIFIICFLKIKKNDKKEDLIEYLILTLPLILAINIFIGMVFGLLNISINITVYTIIYLLLSLIILIKMKLKSTKEEKYHQRYYLNKITLILLVFIVVFVGYVVIKDRRFFDGAMKFGVTDSAIHYKAAKHYRDYFNLLINIEDKSAYDFNYMQTGAYITDGIMQKIFSDLTSIKDYYVYDIYETFIYLVHGMLFVSIVSQIYNNVKRKIELRRDENTDEKVKGIKTNLILVLILVVIYMYGYPYESYLMGFSYLSVGMLFLLAIIKTILLYFRKEEIVISNFDKIKIEEKRITGFSYIWLILLIGLFSFGLIFSYSLYVPAMFSTIVIVFFIYGILEKKKRIIHIIDIRTLLILVLLIIITVIGALYLLVPTYHTDGVESLSSAIANYGYVHELETPDYIYYLPLIALGCYYLLKNRENLIYAVFILFALVFSIIMYVGFTKELVSRYYLSKVYFYDWIFMILISIYGVSNIINNKTWNNIIPAYVLSVALIIIAGIVITCNETFFNYKTFNSAGMFWYENCFRRNFIDVRYNFKKREIDLAEHLKTIDDINIDNTLIIAKNNYHIYWIWSIADFKKSEDPTDLFVNFAADYKSEENIEDKYKYVIILRDEGNKKDFVNYFKVIYENQEAVLLERIEREKFIY